MKEHRTKILFIQPPVITGLKAQKGLKYPPMGIAFLGSFIRMKGYRVQIFDAGIEVYPFHKLKKILKEYNPNVVGISFTSLLAESAYFTASFVKKINPNIIVIAGGYHPTVFPFEVIKEDNFDFVIVGEGEITFMEWLQKTEESKTDYEQVNGLVFKKDGKIIRTEKRELIPNLDTLPFPAYDLLPIHSYSSFISTRKPYVTFIRSRGCPFNCLFCGVKRMFGYKYRCQSPEKTITEIEILINKFGIKEILFKDSDFLIDIKNVERLCHLLIEKRYDFIWSCNARVDMINEDILRLMKRAGCRVITYGVESGNQEILDRLCKGITLEQSRKAIKLTKKIGIQAVINIILGSPGETKESLKQTLDFVKELDPDYVGFLYLTAFPGSALYDESLRNNWFINGIPKSYSYEQLSLNATKMSTEELSGVLKYATRDFYLRPKYILKRLRHLTLAQIKNNIKGVWAIIKTQL